MQRHTTGGLEKMNINYYVGRYLDSIQDSELKRKIDADESLVAEIKGYAGMIRMVKGLGSIEVDGDKLLLDVYAQHRAKGEILLNHRTWYDRQIRELQAYINSL